MSKKNAPHGLDFLLVNICHLHHSRARRLFEALGLYRGQPPLLRVLWETEGLTQTDLAERMQIAPATLTRMIQRMERAGFLRRQSDPVDQRISRVFLTEAGCAIQNQVEQTLQRMEDETFAGFTEEERGLLDGFLRRMRANLLQVTGEEPWE